MTTTLVMKFGGTSVADPARIEAVADIVAKESENGHGLCVVVSAMAGVTNELVGFCQEIDPSYHGADYDTVLAAGEQITAGLLSIALQKRGLQSRSWLGWQVPIACNTDHGKARITDIPSEDFTWAIDRGEIAVVAGFQGVSDEKRITTLGRGGSDTTAVALAAALKAKRCDIYTDVDGLYSADPRLVPNARKIDRASYEEVLEMAGLGAKVLHARAAELAMKENVALRILSSFEDGKGTMIGKEDETMENPLINAVTHSDAEVKVTLVGVQDIPGVAAQIIGPLADNNISVDMIVQNIAADGRKTDMTFTIAAIDRDQAQEALEPLSDIYDELRFDSDIAKVSIVGVGVRSHAKIAQKLFQTLADNDINIQVITTSDIKISVLVAKESMTKAVQILHSAYGLDK